MSTASLRDFFSDCYPFKNKKEHIDFLKKEVIFLRSGIETQRELIEIYKKRILALGGEID